MSQLKEDEEEDDCMDDSETLKKEIENLSREEEDIDIWINDMKTVFENLTKDENFKNYGYVTFDDIKSLTNGEDINLIAIKAPAGTSLEIPDPNQIHSIYLQTLEVTIIIF